MAKPDHRRDPGRAEWIVGFASAGMVALLLGYLIFQAARDTATLPKLEVIQTPAGSQSAQLRFAVRNGGTRAAREVTVALHLRGAPDGPEKWTLTIDFVPGNSEVTGAFLLDGDAPGLVPDLRVESYLDP